MLRAGLFINTLCGNAHRAFPHKALAALRRQCLFLLMTVAAKALLALVRGYLMTFTFLTARHNFVCFRELLK
jgi:hypothetical protein